MPGAPPVNTLLAWLACLLARMQRPLTPPQIVTLTDAWAQAERAREAHTRPRVTPLLDDPARPSHSAVLDTPRRARMDAAATAHPESFRQRLYSLVRYVSGTLIGLFLLFAFLALVVLFPGR